VPVALVGRAGIRETDDPVELEGGRRGRERANAADWVLWVVDASGAGDSPLAAGPSVEKMAVTAPMWVIRNKTDLTQRTERGSQNGARNESGCLVNKPLRNVGNDDLAARSKVQFNR